MKSLFDEEPYAEIKKRINRLNRTVNVSGGKWTLAKHFTMSAAFECFFRKRNIKKQYFPLAFLFKKSLYNDKPWRQNLPTATSFKIIGKQGFRNRKSSAFTIS